MVMPKLSSLYPIGHQAGTLLRFRSAPPSASDSALVTLSSAAIIGSLIWTPLACIRCYQKWKHIKTDSKDGRRRKIIYGALLFGTLALVATGPHRHPKVGEALNVRKWRLWTAFLNYFGFEVVFDSSGTDSGNGAVSPSTRFDITRDPAIFAFIPHGIVPFPLALAFLPEALQDVFGRFRPVVATATNFFPLVRTLISWFGGVDASRSAVDQALSKGSRIGLAPGGIAEMFEGYPKPRTHPNDECAILASRKGFIRMSLRHGVPVVPIYVFGATKLFKRIQLPAFFEYLSNLLRISICIFFGRWGLPVPFRQRLLYVMGRPMFPPSLGTQPSGVGAEGGIEFEKQVDAMHSKFCDQLVSLFDRNKESYGWGHKRLCLV